MPSGTMAQQIALRILCEERSNFNIAMHPSSHPEFAEHAGYQFLHGIRRLQFGAPEFIRGRILNTTDFELLGQTPAAALIELPFRPLSGQLPPWQDLLRTREWAFENDVALHMDGARVWSCRPFYQKSYADIAALFDSVYLSFYKDLGGLAGAMLLGTDKFIDEAKIWQKRHGGQISSMAGMLASAKLGFDRALPEIDSWVSKAKEISEIMNSFSRVSIKPDPPQVNFFHVFIHGNADELNKKNLQVAEETGTFVFYGFSETIVPDVAVAEVMCWENAQEFDLNALAPFLEKLLAE